MRLDSQCKRCRIDLERTWLDVSTLPDGIAGTSPVFYGNITCFEKNCHGDLTAKAQCTLRHVVHRRWRHESDSRFKLLCRPLRFDGSRVVTQNVVAGAFTITLTLAFTSTGTSPATATPSPPATAPPTTRPTTTTTRTPAPPGFTPQPTPPPTPPPTPFPTPFTFRTDDPTLFFTPPPTPVAPIDVPTPMPVGIGFTTTTARGGNIGGGGESPVASPGSGSGDSTVGIIVGAAVGGVLLIGCALLIAFLFLRNSRKKALLHNALSADAAYLAQKPPAAGGGNQFGGTPMSQMEPMESARATNMRSTHQTRSTAVSSTSDLQPYAQPYATSYASSASTQYQASPSPYAGTAYSSDGSSRTSVPYVPEPRNVPSPSDYKLLATVDVAGGHNADVRSRCEHIRIGEPGRVDAVRELQLKPYTTSAYSPLTTSPSADSRKTVAEAWQDI
jgi:hypothetical protein